MAEMTTTAAAAAANADIAEGVASAVHAVYAVLPTNGKPRDAANEFTVLAGIVGMTTS